MVTISIVSSTVVIDGKVRFQFPLSVSSKSSNILSNSSRLTYWFNTRIILIGDFLIIV